MNTSSRFLIFIFVFALLIALTAGGTQAQDAPQDAESVSLNRCHDANLGVSFLCHPDWAVISNPGMMLIVLSDYPRVTFTVIRSEEGGYSVEELTDPVLKIVGQYSDGFDVQVERVGGENALSVVGVSEKDSEIGLLDFYAVQDGHLYSFLFAFSPKKVWPNFRDLIFEIKESIQFQS